MLKKSAEGCLQAHDIALLPLVTVERARLLGVVLKL
jgi:hypothetical protein